MSEEDSYWDQFVEFLRDWVNVSDAYDPESYPDPAKGAERLEQIADEWRDQEEKDRSDREREAADEYEREFGH